MEAFMAISMTTTVALTINIDVVLTSLSDEELKQLASALEAASKTVRNEQAARWAASGKAVRNPLLEQVWKELGR
jgi:arsenate reductase-like glutaredoxin family protein